MEAEKQGIRAVEHVLHRIHTALTLVLFGSTLTLNYYSPRPLAGPSSIAHAHSDYTGYWCILRHIMNARIHK